MDLEGEIGRHLASGDLTRAASRVVEGYGPEVLGFLVVFMGSRDDAYEVFQQTSEDLWVGISKFERRSSVRTWFYVLARHAAARFARSPHGRRGRHRPISQVSELVARTRSATPQYMRTDVKDAFAEIRDALAPDDRALLMLRIDREMSWSEIVSVLGDDETDGARPSARFRKRFQLVKDEIRVRARAAGLVQED